MYSGAIDSKTQKCKSFSTRTVPINKKSRQTSLRIKKKNQTTTAHLQSGL